MEAIYHRMGITALRGFLSLPRGTEAILGLLRTNLPVAAQDVDTWWRDTAAEYAAGAGR